MSSVLLRRDLDGDEPPVDPAPSRGRVAKFLVPEIVFGLGSLAEAGHAARRLGGRHVFVVTDAGIVEAGWAAELLGVLCDAGLRATVWDEGTPNPKDHEVTAAHGRYQAAGCDVILALGGGSCIDAAKAVAVLSTNGGSILDYEGVDRVAAGIPPLVMIPTTSGTGADVSQFAVITDTARRLKATIIGRALVPDISITDPRLLTTMPEELNAATGLDALTHGIEAYVSRAANCLTDGHALNAVRLVGSSLLSTFERPADLDARTTMARASLEAGMAFTNAILGATHAMSHQVGGLLDLPHGVVNAVLLPHVIRFNASGAPERILAVADALGVDVRGMTGDEAGAAAADTVRTLADKLGVPRGLADLGVTPEDVPVLAANALHDACITTNPRAVGTAEAEHLFLAAL